MDKLAIETARVLINFSGQDGLAAGLAEQQLQGTVALHNMLAEHDVAYLADEVGMGKTYIALGVVALMRRFQPGLRVLYLAPKNNVRDKWRKDYRSFIEHNYLRHDCIVKGVGNLPAAPYRRCKSLVDLIQAVATDSVRDFFICASAFSLHMGNTRKELSDSLALFRRQLPQAASQVDELAKELEAHDKNGRSLDDIKEGVKQCWARTLNSLLPPFDLVVVDEAHNYRHGKETAARNRLLATVLGTGEREAVRAQRVLMLSATPFDRDVGQLQRQLELFGKDAPQGIPRQAAWEQVHAALRPFMVRRLNALTIAGRAHTRNMYRTEHRSGPAAEIRLGLKQQLFAALLQKKVSESLNQNNCGRFELGMLASLESYLPAQGDKPVLFDGLDDQRAGAGEERDAPDRNVVEALVRSYARRFHEFPPHPKMDQVAVMASAAALDRNKKQLIFVRRVASVGELKAKIEDEYNRWIGQYVASDPAVHVLHRTYLELVGKRNHGQLDDESNPDAGSVATFFSWFYRGDNEHVAAAVDQLGTTPANYRTVLASSSMMFSTNWSNLPGMPDPAQLDLGQGAGMPPLAQNASRQQQFEHAQLAYLVVVARGSGKPALVARRILAVHGHVPSAAVASSPAATWADAMRWSTLWDVLRKAAPLVALGLPWDETVFDILAGQDEGMAVSHIRRILIHRRLVATVCRLDHPFIDLYALRGSRGKREDGSADDNLMAAFTALLVRQSARPDQFSSYTILRDLCQHLALLLKQNFEDVGNKSVAELTVYFARQLQPLSPVLGATGENASSRTAIARKFRMPGYPRVLISTDVFQEGEDLHTFCDSVIHYGISASPIALEQKVGRVDRIASLAHRALNSVEGGAEAHFIQVNFPHIRESLEFLQVRQAARNLNLFLRSMNRVGDAPVIAEKTVVMAEQLLDQRPVDPPLTHFLASPFEVSAMDLLGADKVQSVLAADQAMQARIRHVQEMVEGSLSSFTDRRVALLPMQGRLQWDSDDGVRIMLRGAHGRPHLLLCAARSVERAGMAEATEATGSLAGLRDLQRKPFQRVQLFSDAEPGTLGRFVCNAEIYAGGAGVLSGDEVIDVYCRVATGSGRSILAAIADAKPLAQMVRRLTGTPGVYRVEAGDDNVLHYHFDFGQRRQSVRWTVNGCYALFTAVILDPQQAALLLSEKGLAEQYTVRRNAAFDMVDFHIDEQLGLSVRALHPLQHLNQEELDFTASQVAAEADRLYQILTLASEQEADDDGDTSDEEPDRSAIERRKALKVWAEECNVMCLIRDLVAQGPLKPDELIRQTGYRLGYLRVSSNIREVLEGLLRAAARRGIVVRQDGTIHLFARSINEYDDTHLREQFLAALSRESNGWVERAQAILAFARWMGYARTGPVIAETGASLIRKLLRAGRLAADGAYIRRVRG